MFTTVPMKSARGLDAPVTAVMHHGIVALPATATLADAVRTMHDHGVHAVLIQDADGASLGWITSRGILHNHARDWTLAEGAVEAITEVAATVASTGTIADAINVFIGTGASHILVTESTDRPIGLVAESDLVAFLAD
jgi:predicted transcriptional regulator